MRLAVLCFLVSAMLSSVSRAQAPVFKGDTPEESTVHFFVKASARVLLKNLPEASQIKLNKSLVVPLGSPS